MTMADRAPKKTVRKGKAAPPVPTRTMSDDHKAALARGREQGRAVRAYLEALEAHRPRRGRKRTAESVQRQLAETEAKLSSATGLDRVLQAQRQLDLRKELEDHNRTSTVDLAALEDRFASVVGAYSEAKGISYEAWREVGVAAGLLRRGGVTPSGS
jgi:hypothetical protein